ncbi:neprilysin-21-like [Rhipicephalus microplus]|uniref:neprilysin-21-like n=1 Tax=Rhipicephalus microplus TaxID=6941 RepID=UPI003F6B5F04
MKTLATLRCSLTDESEEHPLYNSWQAQDDSEEQHKPNWMTSWMVAVLALGLTLLCSVIAFAFVQTAPSFRNKATTADTRAPHHLVKSASSRITTTYKRTPLLTANASANPLLMADVPVRAECQTPYCHMLSGGLRIKLDYNVNPCTDFYKFVCNSFSGKDEFVHIKESLRRTTLEDLQNTVVPPYNQNAWEKAAAMYQACVSFASSYMPETGELRRWMISMNLDLYNYTTLSKVHSVEMMVRGSLDLGLHVMLYISFAQRTFIGDRRHMQMGFSKEQDEWLLKRDDKGFLQNIGDYSLLFLMYGVRRGDDSDLAAMMVRYERKLLDVVRRVRSKPDNPRYMFIHELGNRTDPYVFSDDWVSFFYKYTNGTYRHIDLVQHQPHTTAILLALFKSQYVGIKGLRYLVAWSIYRQLAEFTEPYLFRGERTASDACYTHVETPMHLVIISKYFNDVGSLVLERRTKVMVSHILDIFKQVIANSSWVGQEPFEALKAKLDDLVVNVGDPGDRLDSEFIERFFAPLGDVPVTGLFRSWMKASSVTAHYAWSDQKTPLYDEADFTARYYNNYNIVTVPSALIHWPFIFPDGPIAMDYGGLGMVVGHEFMHSLGVQAIQRATWATKDFLGNYTEKVFYLRRSHQSVLSLSRLQETIDEILDSENLADLVGTSLAYTAFTLLDPKDVGYTLPGLDMTSEQLFFVLNCVKLCTTFTRYPKRYAPYRSRCNVPLMNMDEFANAFGCSQGAPMNPPGKCYFW